MDGRRIKKFKAIFVIPAVHWVAWAPRDLVSKQDKISKKQNKDHTPFPVAREHRALRRVGGRVGTPKTPLPAATTNNLILTRRAQTMVAHAP